MPEDEGRTIMSELTTAELLNSLPRPYPAGGQENYQNILNERFKMSALCKENYEQYRQATSGTRNINTVDYDPIRLDAENCSRCNFACSMLSGEQMGKWHPCKRYDIPRIPEDY